MASPDITLNKYLDSLKPMEGTLTWEMWKATVSKAFEPNHRWNMKYDIPLSVKSALSLLDRK